VEQYQLLVRQVKLSDKDLLGFASLATALNSTNVSVAGLNSRGLTSLMDIASVGASSRVYECSNQSDSISRQMLLKQLMRIRDDFLLSGSPNDIGLPNKLFKKFDFDVRVNGNYHPIVLSFARQHVIDTISVAGGLLSKFLSLESKHATSSVLKKTLPDLDESLNLGGITLNSVLKGKTSCPFSKEEFYEFLREHNAEEYVKFLDAARAYRNAVTESGIPEHELRKEAFKRNVNPASEDMTAKKDKLKQSLQDLKDNYVLRYTGDGLFGERSDHLVEAFKTAHGKGIIHPEILKPLTEFVKDDLRTSHFVKFMDRPYSTGITRSVDMSSKRSSMSDKSIPEGREAFSANRKKSEGDTFALTFQKTALRRGSNSSVGSETARGFQDIGVTLKNRRDSSGTHAGNIKESGHETTPRRGSISRSDSSKLLKNLANVDSKGESESSPTSRKSFNKGSGLSVEKMLANSYASPYTLSEFINFLKMEFASETLEFLLAKKEYDTFVENHHLSEKQLLPRKQLLLGATSSIEETPDATNQDEQELLAQCHSQLLDIYNKFISSNSPKDIGLPSKISKKFHEDVELHQNYHPSIFKEAVDNCDFVLRESLFPRFSDYNTKRGFPPESVQEMGLKENQLKSIMSKEINSSSSSLTLDFSLGLGGIAQSTAINTDSLFQMLLSNCAPEPYSLEAFETFLREEYALPNWNFLKDVEDYRHFVSDYPRGLELLQQSVNSQFTHTEGQELTEVSAEDQVFIQACRAKLLAIEEHYLTAGATDEVSIPSKIRIPFHDVLHTQKTVSPDILVPLKDYVVISMTKSFIPRFVESIVGKNDISPRLEDIICSEGSNINLNSQSPSPSSKRYTNEQVKEKDKISCNSSCAVANNEASQSDETGKLSFKPRNWEKFKMMIGKNTPKSPPTILENTSLPSLSSSTLLFQLLTDSVPKPYSKETFENFVKQENAFSMWKFLLDVQKYTALAESLGYGSRQDDTTDKDSTDSSAHPPVLFSTLLEIQHRYLDPKAEEDLGFPVKLLTSFQDSLHIQKDIYPQILSPLQYYVECVLTSKIIPRYIQSTDSSCSSVSTNEQSAKKSENDISPPIAANSSMARVIRKDRPLSLNLDKSTVEKTGYSSKDPGFLGTDPSQAEPSDGRRDQKGQRRGWLKTMIHRGPKAPSSAEP
jgi:hypothetical protein